MKTARETPRRNTQIKQYLSVFLDRPLAVHRIFGKIAGGLSAGVMLSQAYYWCDKGSNPDWFWKTQAEWQEETLLSRREQETARRSLLLLRTADGVNVWEEQRRGQPARLYFRLNLEALSEVIETYLNGGIVHSSMAENANLEWLETPFKDGEKRQSILHRIQTENTTENTPNSDLDFFSKNANGKSNGNGATSDPQTDGTGNGYKALDDPAGIAESPKQLAALQDYHKQLADREWGDTTPDQERAGLTHTATAQDSQQYWLNFVGGVDLAQVITIHNGKAAKAPTGRTNGHNGVEIPKDAPKAPSGARKGATAKVKAGGTG